MLMKKIKRSLSIFMKFYKFELMIVEKFKRLKNVILQIYLYNFLVCIEL